MKIIKLIQNETIKTLKKTSTKILILLAILALLGAVRICKRNNSFGQLFYELLKWQYRMEDRNAKQGKLPKEDSRRWQSL